jgi:hypothetical protein
MVREKFLALGRSTSPRVTKNSVWNSDEELFDRKRPLEMRAWSAIQDASRFFSAPWAPQNDEAGSISAELAFNVSVSQGVMLKQQKPWEIYGCFKLQVKDTGRPRFHVLVREPSREEISDEGIMPYMIAGGPLAGKILLRIRTVQGHSGARAQNMVRINQKVVPKVEYPALLMHSTKLKFMQSIGRSGLVPGGLTRGRVDVFMADANDFGHDAFYGKMFAPRVGPGARCAHAQGEQRRPLHPGDALGAGRRGALQVQRHGRLHDAVHHPREVHYHSEGPRERQS